MPNLGIKNFLNLIKQLNGGMICPPLNDENSQIQLPSDKMALFQHQLPNGTKYLYFSSYSDGDVNTDTNCLTLSDIEDVAICQRDNWWPVNEKIKASDSYLVLFWEVPEINQDVLKKVIELEENEFWFKKFVFYYTATECQKFFDWYASGNYSKSNIKQILYELPSDNIKDISTMFLLRFLIKIPCIDLPFTARDLPEFESLVKDQINAMRGENKKILVECMLWFQNYCCKRNRLKK